MIWEPIETRYNLTSIRDRQILNSSAFAIAAGVVGVGAAAAGTAMSMSAADRAAKAQGAAGKQYTENLAQAGGKYELALKTFNRQQKKLRKEVQKLNPNLEIPEYNLQNATLEGIEAANKVTANTLMQLEQVAPGSAQARQQVGGIIGSYLRGEVPQDVQEQITRMTAERAGAGFRPQQGMVGPSGFQAAQGQLSRNLGLTSLDLQRQGVNMAASWQQTAGSFIKDPTQMMALGLQGRGQDIDVAQANIMNQFRRIGAIGELNTQQLGAARDLYGMQTGQSQAGYGVAQQGIESTLASRQAVGQGIQSIGSATSGALMGVGGAYGQLAAAQGASTTPTSAGFYQGQVGAANAYGVAPSQLSYQKPTGGFLGIGGQGGGYYYTPGGVYGRA